MPATLLTVAFLLGHAAIHLGFVSPAPRAPTAGPEWPFDRRRSWLLGALRAEPEIGEALGAVLVVGVVAGYVAAALGLLGVLPDAALGLGVLAGTVASLALLTVFFHRWLVIGVAIDLVLLWIALTGRLPAAPMG